MDSLLIEQFQEIVLHNLDLFCLKISTDQVCAFSDYYQLILKWNNYLPLTTLISPEDFALKNILESGFAVPHIKPAINQVLDIGSGSGLPGIPIAILRPDLIITLVEANKKKAIFLKEAAAKLLLKNLIVLNQRFEDIETVLPDFCITSRAIDKFSQLLPRVMNLSASGGQILLFCNEDLLQKIKITLHLNWEGHSYLIPGSDRRLLISLSPSL